jgi:hypothetical protein
MSKNETFRPISAYFYGGSIFIGSIIFIGQSFMYDTSTEIIQTILWSLLASQISYAIFIRPKIIFFDAGLIIDNPFSTFKIGWNDVEDVQSKFSMSIQYKGRSYYAWAAPAPGRYHGRTIHPSEIKGMRISDSSSMRPGESPRTHSGIALEIARRYIENFKHFSGDLIVFEKTFAKTFISFFIINVFLCSILAFNHF